MICSRRPSVLRACPGFSTSLKTPSPFRYKRSSDGIRVNVATIPDASSIPSNNQENEPQNTWDLSAPPPFTLRDLRAAIPDRCFEKNVWKSMSYLALDLGIVAGLAASAFALNQWWAWPLYWFAQGTMFWALFVVGHDCGHQSFSNSKTLNDILGNITHSSILVPYHGWRVSHRKHHANHGHVENDESWYPTTKGLYDKMEPLTRIGRLSLPWSMFAFPFYLWKRSPGKSGSHYNADCDMFKPEDKSYVTTSNGCLIAMVGILLACTAQLGIPAMFNLYFMPYWFFVLWLDLVTYLQHHGSSDPTERLPWFRGEEWSYLRGGLTTLDRDYGIFSKIHHSIGIHVVHHMFPQIPHYNLADATEAVKPVMGRYYREPVKSPGWFPTQLLEPLMRSFANDHYVEDKGNVLFYKRDPTFGSQQKQ